MTNRTDTFTTDIVRAGSCDIKVWSGECEHTANQNVSEKYLCDLCGTIPSLDHEVKPSALCYVSGDYGRMH